MNNIDIIDNGLDVVDNCDAIAVLTEWDEFKTYNWSKIISQVKVLDGRSIIPHANYTIGK
jgi:UDPglucose 6-dehydrogenase